jgi:hypothetical protein
MTRENPVMHRSASRYSFRTEGRIHGEAYLERRATFWKVASRKGADTGVY